MKEILIGSISRKILLMRKNAVEELQSTDLRVERNYLPIQTHGHSTYFKEQAFCFCLDCLSVQKAHYALHFIGRVKFSPTSEICKACPGNIFLGEALGHGVNLIWS